MKQTELGPLLDKQYLKYAYPMGTFFMIVAVFLFYLKGANVGHAAPELYAAERLGGNTVIALLVAGVFSRHGKRGFFLWYASILLLSSFVILLWR